MVVSLYTQRFKGIAVVRLLEQLSAYLLPPPLGGGLLLRLRLP
jgi:hypothetical protein